MRPKYTKAHYIETARIIHATAGGMTDSALTATIRQFADMYQRDNPRFDLARWETACRQGLVSARPGTTPRPIRRLRYLPKFCY